MNIAELKKLSIETIKSNTGFCNIFMEDFEWKTFLKRKPVRNINKKHSEKCYICGKAPTKKNPFQHSHRIGFEMGVVYLGLSPTFIDSHENIVSAHRSNCNAASELNILEAMRSLKNKGIDAIPKYLPDSIQQLWIKMKNPSSN